MEPTPAANRRHFLTTIGLAIACAVGFFVGRNTVDAPPAIAKVESVPAGDAVQRPLIGIASLTDDNYVRAIRESGGIPLVLPNTDGSIDRIDEYLVLLDGLLMPGGADIPPSEYGEEQHETVKVLDEDRFLFERALCKAWIEQTDKPLLGICLGSQWINVSSGGSLVQDIPSAYGVNHRGVEHPVEIAKDSKLREILGENNLVVNSSHHQSVKEIGKNLRAVASSPDGIIEATETTDPNRFLIGVQWHPERMLDGDTRQANLLKEFVNASVSAAVKSDDSERQRLQELAR